MGAERKPAANERADAAPHQAEEGCDLDLSREQQREIHEFARRLPEMSYYDVLGIAQTATARQVRQGFFERSKSFHPDRYFRKNLGPFAELLNEIFKRVATAHEVLRDPKLRDRYDQTLEPVEATALDEPATPRTPIPPSSTGRARGRSLRTRRGVRPSDFTLRSLKSALVRGIEKAAAHFDEAMQHCEQENWVRAVAALRMAMTLDPRQRKYHDALAEVVPRANEQMAREALERSRLLLEREDLEGALPYLESAAELRPMDAALAGQAARLHLAVGKDFDQGLFFGQRAAQLEESNPRHRKTLARLHRAAGHMDEARMEYERAIVLDPEDKESKSELSAIWR